MNILVVGLLAVVGILAGGIVNVLADDLPQRQAVRIANVLADDLPQRQAVRRPHYPDDLPRTLLAWLGLTAFLTGQRRSPDGAALSWRHPVVEMVMGLAFALIAAAYPLDGQRILYLLFLAILLLITVIDLEHRLILFVVIIPACVLAILESILFPVPPPPLGDALLGGLLGFVVFFLMFLGGIGFSALMAALRGEEIPEVAFGFGDVLLATLSGLLLGWQAFLFALMITVFLGAAGAVLFLLSRFLVRGQYTLFTALPYGPYIVLGTVIMLFWRDEVRAIMLR